MSADEHCINGQDNHSQWTIYFKICQYSLRSYLSHNLHCGKIRYLKIQKPYDFYPSEHSPKVAVFLSSN